MFSQIKAKNFLSWEELEFNVPGGLSQITGWNEDDGTNEGSGKSSILNAACWAIYGNIPKDAKVDDVVREGASGAFVEVTLVDGHKVVRTRGPNDLRIVQPGTLKVVRGKDARDTQKMVLALVGLSFDAFCQTVYFAQNDPRRFVNASEAEKASILSEILDLSHFDRAKDRTSNLMKEAQTQVRVLEGAMQVRLSAVEQANLSVERAQRDLAGHAETLRQEATAVEERIDQLREKRGQIILPEPPDADEIKNLKSQIVTLKAQEKNYAGEVRAFTSAQRRVDVARQTVDRTSKAVTQTKDDLGEYDDHTDFCPTCGGPANDEMRAKTEKKVAALQGRLQEAKKAKKVATEEFSASEAALAQMKEPEEFNAAALHKAERSLSRRIEEQEAHDRAVTQKETLKARIQDAKAERERILARSDATLQKRLEEAEGRLKATQAEVGSDEEALVALRSRSAQLSALKEGFPEIKRYVFRTFLAELSRAASQNLRALFDQSVRVVFSNQDEEGGASKIQCKVTIDGQERPLGLYSGGQHRRIQIAVDLALSSAVASRTGRPVSLRVLDEPFKDLSERSVERSLALLKSLPGSTVIVEHSPLVKASVEETFHCVLTGGVSRRA